MPTRDHLRHRPRWRHRLASITVAVTLGAGLGLFGLGTAPASAAPNWAATVASAGGYAASHVATGGVAVLDRLTGQLWTGGEATSRVSTASTAKALVAADLLYRNARGYLHLSSYDWSQMTVMIEQSSNTAMEYLYNKYGGVNIIRAVIARYHLSQTLPPYPPSFWGFTAITAHDYALFLARAAADSTVGPWLIDAESHSQRFVNGFDQWFGIPASGVYPFAVKQGWTCCDTGDILNSTGFVGPGWRYAVAILTSASTAVNHRAIINTVAALLIPGGRISNDNPSGAVDVISVTSNIATVRGWAFDPNDSAYALKVVVYADGAIAAYGPTTVARPDINAAYRLTGTHGYSLRLHLRTGTHRVCAYGINIGPGANSSLGCRTVILSGSPAGALESLSQQANTVTARGWGYDYNVPTQPIKIVVYADGAIAAYGPTTVARPDVNATFGITGTHGYSIPLQLSTGTHRVCTYGINVGPGANSTLGCQTVTVG